VWPFTPAHDVCRAHCARLAGNFSAAAEQRQGRDAADAEARRQRLLRFGVDLGQAYRGLEHAGGLDEGGRHLAAGTTPWRPEVNQHRGIAAVDVTVEVRAIELDRVAGKKRLAALSARGDIGEAGDRDTVHCIAVGADQVQSVGHGGLRAISDSYHMGAARTGIKSVCIRPTPAVPADDEDISRRRSLDDYPAPLHGGDLEAASGLAEGVMRLQRVLHTSEGLLVVSADDNGPLDRRARRRVRMSVSAMSRNRVCSTNWRRHGSPRHAG
jgi:hypothetical protein